MNLKNIQLNSQVVLTSLNYTNLGILESPEKYINTIVEILDFKNDKLSTNNVQIKTYDDSIFWCSNKDIKEIKNSVGLSKTKDEIYNILGSKIQEEKNKNKNSLIPEVSRLIKKIIWDIEHLRNVQYNDVVPKICNKHKIEAEILYEIYFQYCLVE